MLDFSDVDIPESDKTYLDILHRIKNSIAIDESEFKQIHDNLSLKQSSNIALYWIDNMTKNNSFNIEFLRTLKDALTNVKRLNKDSRDSSGIWKGIFERINIDFIDFLLSGNKLQSFSQYNSLTIKR